MPTSSSYPSSSWFDAERVQEIPARDPPALVHAGWAERFPWLVQGTTTRGVAAAPFDLGLFSGGDGVEGVRARWDLLRRTTEADVVVHAKQVHGDVVRVHERMVARETPLLAPECDGHVTAEPGTLLAVTVADCVPVFVVDADRRAVGMLHAGWRGAAVGVLERGVDTMRRHFGTRVRSVHVHLGPSICGSCYEVGPEVFEALRQGVPSRPSPIDLRAVLATRAARLGVAPTRISISTHCTLCTESGLFSHRGGDRHRQVGYVGVRS